MVENIELNYCLTLLTHSRIHYIIRPNNLTTRGVNVSLNTLMATLLNNNVHTYH